MVYVTPKPAFYGMGTSPTIICKGATAQMDPLVSSNQTNQITTPLQSNQANGGVVFNVSAIKPISIFSVYAELSSGSQAEVWYKTGGYGSANVTSSSGWTKLGATVFVSPAGIGQYTLIPVTATLNIPAGQTFGIAVITNGVMRNKSAAQVDGLVSANLDLAIMAGHSGVGMGGNFDFTNSPRAWCGKLSYVVSYGLTNFAWSPSTGLSNTNTSNPTVNITTSTNYTLTVTDGNGCTNSASMRAYVRSYPQPWITATPSAICAGSSSQLNVTTQTADADWLAAPTTGTQFTATNGGVLFNISTVKAIQLTQLKTRVSFGASQAEVWYKIGGYGNGNVTSSSGWIKIGNTINFLSNGPSGLSSIPLSTPLSIPANSTYGIAVVCNSNMYYSNGSAVGATISSSPDCSIQAGHSGTGFGGSFNFTTVGSVFNGELHFTVPSVLTSYAWTNSAAISNSTVANPLATPTSNSSYSVTITDANNCSSVGYMGIVVMSPVSGISTASPATVCAGNSATLQYAAPTGSQCNGSLQTGFNGTYAPATWTTVSGGLGTVNTSSAPNTVVLTSANTGGASPNTTSWQHVIPCSGYVTFNWSYTTNDNGPSTDFPRYAINAATPQVFSGFNANFWYSKIQTGTFSMYFNAGDVLQLQAHTNNNSGGACSITISNFSAPVMSSTNQSIAWYTTPVGGNPIATGNSYSFTSNVLGTTSYYAAVTNVDNGCVGTTRIATNPLTTLVKPTVSVSGANAVCAGESTALTASGANTYSWMPGNFSTPTASVSPTASTTYTVTGTHSNGCSASATQFVNVLTKPIVTASTSSASVTCNGGVQLSAAGASSYYWMPIFQTGSTVSHTPTATTLYTVTGTAANGCTATSTVSVNVLPCSPGVLNLNVLLEGFYIGNGQLTPALYNQGVTASTLISDSVTVEFRSSFPPHPVVHQASAVLKNNGATDCEFPGTMIGNSYYISVKHRNSIETWSGLPVLLSNISYYDFTVDANQAFGSNLKEVEAGVFAMYSGDINQDGAIDAFDYITLDVDIQQGQTGYFTTDLTGDGAVDSYDYLLQDYNIQGGIGTAHP
jgi:hypothetical protein